MVSANDVASVILSRRGPWMDAMTLQKLLYYVQAWHLAVTDEPLFSEHFKAYKDGPVLPQVRHARMDKASRRATAQELSGISIDQIASDIIDQVLATYGSMSGQELSALTHVEHPWLEARHGLPVDAPSNEPISEVTMAQFYRANRFLGGRTAADLAVGGVHVRPAGQTGHDAVDVDALLAELPEYETENPWGSTNLAAVSRNPAEAGSRGSAEG